MTATERLRDLLAVEAAATPGPWYHELYGGKNQSGDPSGGSIYNSPSGDYVITEVGDRDGALATIARNSLRPLTQVILDLAEGHAFTEDECHWTSMDDTGRQYCPKCGYDYPCKPVRIFTKRLGDNNE